MLSDESLTDLMANAAVIASVGVVSDPATKGYAAAAYQQSQGYKVLPVNTSRDMILGHITVSSVADIEEPIDIVNVVAHPQEAPAITDAAIRAGAKAIWFEPGTQNHIAAEQARQAGLQVVTNRSFEREHRRLMSHH
ncbi:CoA-binding protein [Alicyclobacillus fastidiosus]|uniref:CoA-binding protein n=1 Tax=Alicyclobacillus fastidiosus TaxID=392011 RepID=A0ABY6ZKC3_9BACL|nr:CoA-binding protein [Alicyclobacillus fastidiosus]WAH43329.1 CoA-binding protein [Alicyclobacillus fastidiosus]GMA65385.1 succinyl-CoA ligase subunit alpha [Alicyclobacillus fastidiosus]